MEQKQKQAPRPVSAAARLERAYRRLGTREPCCRACGERRPLVLTGTHPEILCYRCCKLEKGQSVIEHHHPAGQHNSAVTMPVDANVHRLLSDAQEDWPVLTLRNPTKSPLLCTAASLRGLADVQQILVANLLAQLPETLEVLDAVMTARDGPAWWMRTTAGGDRHDS